MPATPAWPPRSAPRLFVDAPLAADQPRVLDGPAAHYLAQVMRCSVGDTIILLDNATGEWAARVDATAKRQVHVTVLEQLRDMEHVPDLWLCVAPIKKPHFDMVIEKATELGVARIVPVLTRRCVVDKVNADRARTIAQEAAEQCARTALPDIAPLIKLPQLIDQWPADRTLFHADEHGGAAAMAQFGSHAGPAAIMIGPEGGFDDAERAMISGLAKAVPITLGPRILRAETAALAAVSLWMAAHGEWLNSGRY